MKRKIILLFIIFVSVICVYFIYKSNKHEKINILSIGDKYAFNSYNEYIKNYYKDFNKLNKYNNTFIYNNYYVSELLYDINNNKFANNSYFKQVIHNSNIIILNIGGEELDDQLELNNYNYDYLLYILNQYDSLLREINKISDAKVYVIGKCKNKKDYLNIILDVKLNEICNFYKYKYIKLSDVCFNKYDTIVNEMIAGNIVNQ